jgi:hypothetical protein
MTALTLNTINRNDGATLLPQGAWRSFYAEVPTGSLDVQSQLIEQVMQFAFDTLGVRHLDVRVLGVGMEEGRCLRRQE